jgi:lauroyl/myristoyl acyltransferase
VDSTLHAASVAVPDSAPSTSIWHVFLHGAAFGAGMLATFAALCGALLACDAARRRAVARARLRRALADLDAEDIVALIQRPGGNAEL